MYERMSKVKFIFWKFTLSLTRIQYTTKINTAYSHVQGQTQFLVWLEFCLQFKIQLKNNAWVHVQRQIQLFKFDLNLTTIQFSTHPKNENARAKSNSFISEFDLSST